MMKICLGGHRWTGCGSVFRRRRWMVGMLMLPGGIPPDSVAGGRLGTGCTVLVRPTGTPGGVMLGAMPMGGWPAVVGVAAIPGGVPCPGTFGERMATWGLGLGAACCAAMVFR